jgi:Ca2+:H+ antiporter
MQLVSHADLYENDCTSDYSPSVPSKHSLKCITSATSSNTYQHQQPSPDHSPVSNRPVVDARSSTSNDDEEPMEVKQLVTLPTCIVWLGATTILISLLSDLIASSIENAANDVNISGVFLAAVVLPFIGNTEIISSVKFAWRNKLDGSLGVAVGSSTQIALFHLPLLVVISWCMGLQMSLNFGAYETSTLLVSVIGAVFAIKDGTSNWMIGLIMIASYCIVAVGFFAHKNDSLSN